MILTALIVLNYIFKLWYKEFGNVFYAWVSGHELFMITAQLISLGHQTTERFAGLFFVLPPDLFLNRHQLKRAQELCMCNDQRCKKTEGYALKVYATLFSFYVVLTPQVHDK